MIETQTDDEFFWIFLTYGLKVFIGRVVCCEGGGGNFANVQRVQA